MKLILALFSFIVFLSACTQQGSRIDDGFLGGVKFSDSNSSLALSASTVLAGGSVTITVTARDASGNLYYIPNSNPTVTFSTSGGTSAGTFSSVTNNQNGTYTSTFTGVTAGTATNVIATIDSQTVSTSASIQVISGAPSTPTGLAANVGSSSVAMSWTAVSAASSYNILRGTSAGSLSQIATSATNSYTDTTPTNGTSYYYAVQSVNIGGTSSSSSTIQAEPLAQPVISSVAVNGAGALTVTWGTASGNDSFTLKYSTTSGSASSGTTGCSTTSPTVTCTISSLTAGTTYYFSVVGSNSVGSGASLASSESPGIPLGSFTMTAVSPATSSATVTWGSSTGQTSYDILYDTTSHSSSGSYASSSTGVSSGASVSSLSAGTTYYFRVRANNAYGSLQSTNELSSAVYQAFTMNLPFTAGTSSSYTISDTTRVEMTGGVVRLTAASQTDDDGSASKFGGATMSGVQWDTNLLRLNTTTNNAELDSSWTPQWSSLVGYWKLNEASGATTVADSSGNGNSGSLSSVTLGTSGKLNSSGSFNGTSSSISVPHSTSINISGAITLSAWMKTTISSGQERAIARRSGTVGYELAIMNTGQVQFFSGNSTCFVFAPYSTATVNDGNWHHVVGTINSSSNTYMIFVDGILSSSTTSNCGPGTISNQPLYLGSNGSGDYFSGSLDDLAIWSTALTASEIQTIYKRQSAKYSGLLTSRVMDAFSSQSWTSLTSTTTLPFYKELPSSSGSESSSTGYSSSGGSLINNLVGYWPFNSSTADNSSSPATVSSSSGIGFLEGRLGTAADFNGTSSQLTMNASSKFDFGTSSSGVLTISTWVSPDSVSSDCRQGIVSQRTGSTGFSLTIAGSSSGCNGGGTSKVQFFEGGGFYVQSASLIPTNTWTHILVTANNNAVNIYINGKLDATGTLSWTSSSSVSLKIGHVNSSYYFDGKIDEVAIWNRALSAAEVLELYRRGANRIKYQVRSCSSSDCSDQDALTTSYKGWKGPDNTGLTYFSELYNTTSNTLGGTVSTSSPTMNFSNFGSLAVSSNRYFQYRAVLESDDQNSLCTYNSTAANCSPELQSVTVGPNHYDTTVQTVISKSSLGTAYQSIDSNGFTETLGSNSCSAGTKYAISPDGSSFYYYNGTTWTTSSDYTTANDAATMRTNISSFPGTIGTGTLQIKAFLKSSGTSSCEIDNLAVTGKKY